MAYNPGNLECKSVEVVDMIGVRGAIGPKMVSKLGAVKIWFCF